MTPDIDGTSRRVTDDLRGVAADRTQTRRPALVEVAGGEPMIYDEQSEASINAVQQQRPQRGG